MKTKRRLTLPTKREEEFHSKPVASLMARSEEDLARKFAERAEWLEANKPPDNISRDNLSPRQEGGRHDLTIWRFTWDYLNADLNFDPKPKSTWRDYAPDVARRVADDGLRHLYYLVRNKNNHALASLADIATDASRILSDLSQNAVRRIRPIARHRFFWPFLKASKDCFSDEHKRTVQEIQLSAALPFSQGWLPDSSKQHGCQIGNHLSLPYGRIPKSDLVWTLSRKRLAKESCEPETIFSSNVAWLV